MIVTAHAATATAYCRQPGCTNEAPARGRYAGWCDEHRDVQEKRDKHKPGRAVSNTLEGGLRDLRKLAVDADKARQKAEKMTKAALAAKEHADTLARNLRAKLRELAGDV